MVHLTQIERSALISSFQRDGRGSGCGHGGGDKFGGVSDDRDQLKCEHCRRRQHIKDTCQDLHGYSLDSQARTFPRGPSDSWFGNRLSSAYSITSTPSFDPPAPISSTPTKFDRILSHEEV